MLEIGRLRMSGERSRFRWKPVVSWYSETNPSAQDYYNYVWTGDLHWMWCWIQVTVAPAGQPKRG